jgi:hypothetical protein
VSLGKGVGVGEGVEGVGTSPRTSLYDKAASDYVLIFQTKNREMTYAERFNELIDVHICPLGLARGPSTPFTPRHAPPPDPMSGIPVPPPPW